MAPALRVVLAFVAANAFAAAASLILFPASTVSGFFWDVTPPISAAMLGALYFAAGLQVAYAALRGWWEPARYLAPMVVVFATMILLASYLHLHKFAQGPELDYWLAVYVVALVAAAVFYYQHERGGANWGVAGRRTPRAVRVTALVVGVLAAAFAVAGFTNQLLVTMSPGWVDELWPWALMPLTTLVFLAWVGAFAVGLLWVAYDPDRRRTRPVAYLLVVTAALLAIMLVVHRQDLRPDPVGVGVFCAGLAGLGLLGAFMLLFDRRHLSSAAPPPAGAMPARRQRDAIAAGSPTAPLREVCHG
jgi:hypothetical protein